ncbi:MAG: hypothetical protein H6719_29560 [Sandaracinaceae bacterium]|nr:hypothetical protein [Sandaracinaceae bacterium]
MSSEVVSEHEHLRILWDPELGAVHMQWLDPVGGAPYRDGLDEGLRVLVDKGAERWLADLRWLGVLSRADEAWVNDEWLPRATQAGLRLMAIVSPESSKAQVSIRELMLALSTQEAIAEQRLTTQSFESLDDAQAWLRERG